MADKISRHNKMVYPFYITKLVQSEPTIADVANLLGVTPGTIGNYVRDQKARYSAEKLAEFIYKEKQGRQPQLDLSGRQTKTILTVVDDMAEVLNAFVKGLKAEHTVFDIDNTETKLFVIKVPQDQIELFRTFLNGMELQWRFFDMLGSSHKSREQ